MTCNTNIHAFIFDLGKVIVDWDPRYLLHEIAPEEERLNFLVEEVLDLDWFRSVDAGYPLSKAISERSEIYPEYADAMQMYVDRWPETIRGYHEGTLDIVRQLYVAKFPLFILSNWAKDTWILVEKDMEFLSYFRDRIISGQVGVAKPEKAIFEMAQKRFQVDPKTTLFIDDNQKNIDAAIAAGFESVLFETPEKLASDIRSFGIVLA